MRSDIPAMAEATGSDAEIVARKSLMECRAKGDRVQPLKPGQTAQYPHPAHVTDDALGFGRGIADQRHAQHRHPAIAQRRQRQQRMVDRPQPRARA